MIKFKRYYTAFRRYKRSKGFGIHSPFAFNFVLKVLRERCHYYSYDLIHTKRWEASKLTSKNKERRKIISYKNAKMIFRITCYFNPKSILQIGTNHGIITSSMLSVSSSSHLYSYLGKNNKSQIYDSLTESFNPQISKYDDIIKAINDYNSSLTDSDKPFILLNNIEKENELIVNTLSEALANEGVVIICNINKNNDIKNIWKKTKSSMKYGMSFSNEKIGVIVGYKHLPLQHFSLWF